MSTIRSEISWSKKPSLVLFRANDPFFVEREIERGRALCSSFQVVQGAHIEEHLLRDILFDRGFFAEPVCIFVKNVDVSKFRKVLESYVENPYVSDMVVLHSSSKKEPSWFANLKHNERVVKQKPASWKIPDFIAKQASLLGLYLPSRYPALLHMNLGEDLTLLYQDLWKLKLYIGDRTEIRGSDIQQVCVRHDQLKPFEMLKAWSSKELARTFQWVERLYLQSVDDPTLKLMKLFFMQMEKLLSACSLLSKGFTSDQIREKLQMPYPIFKEFEPLMKKRTEEELIQIWVDLCEVEARVKQGDDGKSALTFWLLRSFDVLPYSN